LVTAELVAAIPIIGTRALLIEIAKTAGDDELAAASLPPLLLDQAICAILQLFSGYFIRESGLHTPFAPPLKPAPT
jgi:hypothetical protein